MIYEAQQSRRPSVEVAVIVIKGDKILIGRQSLAQGDVFRVPGGRWESGESLKECAKREVTTDTGVTCTSPRLISVDDIPPSNTEKSDVTIGFRADYQLGEPRNSTTESTTTWDWYAPEEALRLNLTNSSKLLIDRYLTGVIYG